MPLPASPVHDIQTPLSWWEQGQMFIDTHLTSLMLGLVFVAFLHVVFRHYDREHRNLEKLWLFLLFFLTKRQMMIPLVYTLAKREKVLDSEQLNRLLAIRQECRHTHLKKHPTERMKREKELSELLFVYFSHVESAGQLHEGSALEKIMQDLEFIDDKLVMLQQKYNSEAAAWNGESETLWGKFVFLLFRFERVHFFHVE